MRLVARHGPVKSSLEAGEAQAAHARLGVRAASPSSAATLRIDDLRVDLEAEYPDIAAAIRRQGIASTVGVPLLREGVAIGAITVFRTRGAALHRQAGRAARDLRGPGGDRDRERAPVPGAAGAHPRSLAVAGGDRALSEVIRAVSSSLDLREVLDTVARAAITLAGADGVRHLRVQSGARAISTRSSSQGISRRVRGPRSPVAMDQGTLGRATETRRAGPGRRRRRRRRTIPFRDSFVAGGPARGAHGADDGRRRRAGHRGRPPRPGRVRRAGGDAHADARRPVQGRDRQRASLPGDRGEEPASSRWPTSTSRSSSPTCRTSCARR